MTFDWLEWSRMLMKTKHPAKKKKQQKATPTSAELHVNRNLSNAVEC